MIKDELVKALETLLYAASRVQRKGRTNEDWNQLRAARLMAEVALEKINERE